jgi:hypothetical protein
VDSNHFQPTPCLHATRAEFVSKEAASMPQTLTRLHAVLDATTEAPPRFAATHNGAMPNGRSSKQARTPHISTGRNSGWQVVALNTSGACNLADTLLLAQNRHTASAGNQQHLCLAPKATYAASKPCNMSSTLLPCSRRIALPHQAQAQAHSIRRKLFVTAQEHSHLQQWPLLQFCDDLECMPCSQGKCF